MRDETPPGDGAPDPQTLLARRFRGGDLRPGSVDVWDAFDDPRVDELPVDLSIEPPGPPAVERPVDSDSALCSVPAVDTGSVAAVVAPRRRGGYARIAGLNRRVRVLGREIETASILGWLALVGFLAITAKNARTLQEIGHDWGDDFALYTNQAKSLIEGTPGQVLADTKFSVRESGWAFSPFAYPWGFPIVLAPGVLLFGVNFYKLKLETTGLFLLSLVLFYVFFARRAGRLGALAVVVLVGTNMFSLGWAGAILSEYCYFASVLGTLLVLDWYRSRDSVFAASRWPGIAVGLSVAWTISVRREGVGLLVGVFALQLIEIVAGRARIVARERSVVDVAKRFALPFISFFGSIAFLQLMLPTDVYQNAAKGGTRTGNMIANYPFYRGYLAEHIGLKDPGDEPLRWIHNTFIGPKAMAAFLVLLAVGIIVRTLTVPREDGWVAATLIAQLFVILSVPFHEGRYLYAVTPLVVYFAYQAIPSVLVHFRRSPLARQAGRMLAAVGISMLVLSNMPGLRNALSYHRVYSYIENGPDTVEATEMFAKVRELTRPNDVILFFRARAMNLYTGRRAVQNSDVKRMANVADWYVMEKGSTYGQTLVAPQDAPALGLTMVWENVEWVLWHFDDAAKRRSLDAAVAALPPTTVASTPTTPPLTPVGQQ